MRSPFTDFTGVEPRNDSYYQQGESDVLTEDRENDYGSYEEFIPLPGIAVPAVAAAINASPSCDLAIAVPPFSTSQRQKMVFPLLSPATSKKAREWNAKNLAALKIDPLHVLTDLARYIDVDLVKQEIARYNSANSSNQIGLGTAPSDAVLAEALHQFQCRIFIPTSSVLSESWKDAAVSNTVGNRSGKADYSTLHALGIMPGSFYATMNDCSRKVLGKVGVSVSINGRTCDHTNWGKFMLNPPFLGLTCNLPVHYLLMKQLRIAERYLLGLPRFQGDNLVDMAAKLGYGVNTSRHPGGRSAQCGMHTFGLAIDLGYINNPFIGAGFLTKTGWAGLNKTQRQAKFPESANPRMYERYNFLTTLQKASGQKLTGSVISEYLHYVGKTKGKDTNDVFDELKQRNNEFVAYVKANPSSQKYWDGSATFSGSGYQRRSVNGFLNLDRDLVYALRQVANLAWGAVDIGAGEGGNGDMMHFDMRTLEPGRKINVYRNSDLGKNSGGDPKETHPVLTGVTTQAEFSNEELFRNTSNELEDFEFIYNEEEEGSPDEDHYSEPGSDAYDHFTDEEADLSDEFEEPETESLYDEPETDELETEEAEEGANYETGNEYEDTGSSFENNYSNDEYRNDLNAENEEPAYVNEAIDADNEWMHLADEETQPDLFFQNQIAGIAPPPGLYGGFDLCAGDSDAKGRYAGVISPSNAGKKLVKQLQDDLRALGFGYVGKTSDGGFGVNTRNAVREFQLHAKMDFVAEQTYNVSKNYADTLIQAANTAKYTGYISGVVNAATRSLIQLWLNNHWRCPVVIEAWTMNKGTRTIVAKGGENLWRYNDLADTNPRMFAVDLSGHYRNGTTRTLTDRQVLGTFARFGAASGPGSKPPGHTWPEAEFLPNKDLFTGINPSSPVFPQLTPAQQATFRVIRAVAEVECRGFYDGLNAYDDQFMSIPLTHGTLGNFNDSYGGELGSFVSFFAEQFPAEFNRLFGFCGVKAHKTWGGNGNSLFVSSRRFVSTLSLQEDNGSFTNLVSKNRDEYQWFRSWHWFYRFAMAGRTSAIYQQALWRYARTRLRGLLNTLWDDKLEVQYTEGAAVKTRKATIGDVYTSEKAVAMLLRWHVRAPAHVVDNNVANQRIRTIAANAGIKLNSPLSITAADESALISSMNVEAAKFKYKDTIFNARDFPQWVPKTVNPAGGQNNYAHYTLDISFCNPLSETRNANGFPLDASDLPPSP